MLQQIAHFALIVRDYDEAIAFYTERLGFDLLEDREVPEQSKRWVVIAPPGGGSTLLLARASTPAQQALIGRQGAGRVLLFLTSDDFWNDYQRLLDAGVRFVRAPVEQPYGLVAVFEDLYGNRCDLLQYAPADPPSTAALSLMRAGLGA